MKAYKIEILVIDHEGVGGDDIKSIIENVRYPNRCISPEVKNIDERDIGEWRDDHPLNIRSTCDSEYHRIFHTDYEPPSDLVFDRRYSYEMECSRFDAPKEGICEWLEKRAIIEAKTDMGGEWEVSTVLMSENKDGTHTYTVSTRPSQ